MKAETYCPVFTGFYNTIWEMDETSEIESVNQDSDKEYDYDDFSWDYNSYNKDVCKGFTEAFLDKIQEFIPSVKSVKFQEMRSPREYNFANDAIDIEVEFNSNEIRKYINNNLGAWEKYLEDHYTSCSGFWSSYPNDSDSWKNDTNNYKELSGHYLGSILQFICDNEGVEEFEDFYYNVMDDMYINEYCELK